VDSVTTFEFFKMKSFMLKTKSFGLFDVIFAYNLGHSSPALDGLSTAVNASNLFDKQHVSSCFFSNICYFGPSRAIVESLRYKW